MHLGRKEEVVVHWKEEILEVGEEFPYLIEVLSRDGTIKQDKLFIN